MNTNDYLFVAKTSNWRNSLGIVQERSVALDIRVYDDLAEENIRGVWEKLKLAVSNQNKQFDSVERLPGWASWKVHDWCKASRGVENRQKYVAWDGDVIAGFLFLRPDFSSPSSPGQHLLYVENLATAPGNIRTNLWCRQLKYVGVALLAFSVFQSMEQGFNGDLGLHAADADAESWYEHLNASRNGSLFRPRITGITAPPPVGDAAVARPFLETITDGAARLLGEYRNV
jgi:hypothetical protein